MTVHPTSQISGPELLTGMFHTGRARALDSPAVIEETDAGIIVPGHGPVRHGSAKEAALTAHERASW
ncbi:hypothetical protein ACIQB5_47995 [Streptomyces sp. NPDC088560]|uniref:hypothetical protein n=1 Tax=Streptomyces sp. NPDC088560 TaxID=3365868 RepID=UPI003821F8FB